VIIGHRVHAAELSQVILVRGIIAMPRYHVERRIIVAKNQQPTLNMDIVMGYMITITIPA
jgi:hypothetical protein